MLSIKTTQQGIVFTEFDNKWTAGHKKHAFTLHLCAG